MGTASPALFRGNCASPSPVAPTAIGHTNVCGDVPINPMKECELHGHLTSQYLILLRTLFPTVLNCTSRSPLAGGAAQAAGVGCARGPLPSAPGAVPQERVRGPWGASCLVIQGGQGDRGPASAFVFSFRGCPLR